MSVNAVDQTTGNTTPLAGNTNNLVGNLSALTTNTKSDAVGAINEVNQTKQNATDNNLQTTDKTIVGGINELRSGLTGLSGMLTFQTIEITPEDTSIHYMYVNKPINKSYDGLMLQEMSSTTNGDQAMVAWVDRINLTGDYANKSLIRYKAPIAGLTYKIELLWIDMP